MAFKLLSYNILNGGGERLPQIAGIIRAQQPDAVALMEANSQVHVEMLAGMLGMHYIYGEANSEAAVAWMSYAPIKRSRNHRLDILAKTLLEVEISYEASSLFLFATHLVHGRTAASARHRIAEAQAILSVLHPFKDLPYLLVGDFNALHPRDAVGSPPMGQERGYIARWPIGVILEAGNVDCYRKLHPDVPGYTYASHHPWLRLDYIFASPSIATRLLSCDVVTGRVAEEASDHLPIWAAFNV